MIKRIRYRMGDDGLYISMRAIPTAIGSVFVKYNPTTMDVFIVNDLELVMRKWTAYTPHELKNSVRVVLTEMGAPLVRETRVTE